jgi:hypothetical protein
MDGGGKSDGTGVLPMPVGAGGSLLQAISRAPLLLLASDCPLVVYSPAPVWLRYGPFTGTDCLFAGVSHPSCVLNGFLSKPLNALDDHEGPRVSVRRRWSIVPREDKFSLASNHTPLSLTNTLHSPVLSKPISQPAANRHLPLSPLLGSRRVAGKSNASGANRRGMSLATAG